MPANEAQLDQTHFDHWRQGAGPVFFTSIRDWLASFGFAWGGSIRVTSATSVTISSPPPP